ncbi:hypothetical protein [Actinacidiphila oryziradicis]|uniref:hypothetical protein n=1 Tax=Actinacidiphila oryziradicis TaxID=2571141 RepID=UPI00145F74BF|nr:hypothetical protein [Actinacidiphila oryziradicis]
MDDVDVGVDEEQPTCDGVVAAEHARLADQLHATNTDGIRNLHALAADVSAWANKMHRAAKGDRTLARAAAVRETR